MPKRIGNVVAALTAAGGIMSSQGFESMAAASEGGGVGARAKVVIAIPRVLVLRLADHPLAIDITTEDIARGEIIVRGPRARIIANGRDGYRLSADMTVSPFSGVEIDGLPVPVHIQAGLVASVAIRGGGHEGPESRKLEYRLRIPRGALPGRYRWPISLSVQEP